MKKAMVERLKQKYHIEWFTEEGDAYPVRVFLHKDQVTVALDTTGDSLHKRGYRKLTAKAPIAENLAAALSEPSDTIEDVIEPYLMQLGFVQRTPRGRVITDAGYRHLGLEK